MFDTTSVNTDNHKVVIIQRSRLEKAFGPFLQLAKTNVINLAFLTQFHQYLCAHVYEVA